MLCLWMAKLIYKSANICGSWFMQKNISEITIRAIFLSLLPSFVTCTVCVYICIYIHNLNQYSF